MKMEITPLRQSLNKAYLKVKPQRAAIERFKNNFRILLERINKDESEENAKTHLRDFLNDTWYKENHLLATQGRTDLVIHADKTAQSKAAVLFEVKRPKNMGDMITPSNLNAKALHELILYYLQERIERKNDEIKYLIITNIYDWYLLDVPAFDKIVYQNKALVKDYETWRDKGKAQSTTDFFYKDIAKPFVANSEATLACTYFNLRDYETALLNNKDEDDRQLIPLFKVLSPPHLLKQPFANDSNSLDKGFYNELLHLIGLEEEKEGGKKVIRRKAAGKRNPGSLLENAIATLESTDRLRHVRELQQYGGTREEQLFGVALELVITWVNRILFLKLLEAQLLQYHRGDKAYRFLNAQKITDFDELNELFFEVLAKQPQHRPDYVRSKFSDVPYLNSSLFEITDLEDKTILISNLKDRFQLPLFGKTVLKDQFGKARSGEARPLHYFFEFLDAYDFASEGSEDIQEDNKTLINASVLGLIFEKINGYKDGSFFTPGFITMYMCRETIRRAVLQKFNEHYKWNCADLSELYNKIEDRAKANALINSLRLCDPAVGSGHFLVSALNELIAIKSELRILCDREGKRLRDYHVEVVNDELVVTDEDGNFFAYNPRNRESQRVQETLFREKQTIIENCLFGVDINPNSVKICRLRLWIELLKNAYYKKGSKISEVFKTSEVSNASPVCYADAPELRDEYRSSAAFGELETLPNIDINIKQGNSLISRFALGADLSKALKSIKYDISAYRGFVRDYHHATDKEEKRGLLLLIDQIKGDFRSEIHKNDPLLKRRSKLAGELYNLTQQTALFGLDKKAEQERQQKTAQLESDLAKVETQIATIQNNRLYENAFEWRFEFPEVLDEQGNFVGFDVVMGNPPYIRQEEFSELKPYLQQQYKTYAGTADLLVYFIEKGMTLLRDKGVFNFIISNKFMRANFGKPLREWLQQYRLLQLLDFGDLPVFDEATTYPCILFLQKAQPVGAFYAANIPSLEKNNFNPYVKRHLFESNQEALGTDGWNLSDAGGQRLLQKLKAAGTPLGEYVQGKIFRGVLTGLNEAFVIDEATKNKLIAEDPKSAEVIKPFLAGRDIKRYQTPSKGSYLILFQKGWTKNQFGDLTEEDAFGKLEALYPVVARQLKPYATKAKARYDKGDYWWELRACDYYEEFEKPKIIIPAIVNIPSYVFDKNGFYSNDKTSIIVKDDLYLLGLLNSKAVDFVIQQTSSTKRGGYFEYKPMYVSNLPIANATDDIKKEIESLVTRILAAKQADPAADTSAVEAEIDALVYALYGLTEEEIAIVEGN